MIYTVTMNPAVDYTVRAERIVPGEVNRASEASFRWGGKGINVSVVLHRLGIKTVAVGWIAGFTGKALEEGVRAMGVATRMILLPEGNTRVNVKIKTAEGRRETDLNTPGPAVPPEAADALEEVLCGAGEGDTVCFCGNIPVGISQERFQKMLRRVRDNRAQIVADLTGERLCAALEYRPFLIKPNRAELAELTGRTAQTDTELKQDARRLQQMGARNVLISLAGDGAFLAEENGATHRAEVPAGIVKDSVGAGDSMVAGFLAGWEATRDAAAAFRLAVAAGSAAAYSDGLPEKEEILRLLK